MEMAKIFPTKNLKKSLFVVTTCFNKMSALIGKNYESIIINEILESYFEYWLELQQMRNFIWRPWHDRWNLTLGL